MQFQSSEAFSFPVITLNTFVSC